MRRKISPTELRVNEWEVDLNLNVFMQHKATNAYYKSKLMKVPGFIKGKERVVRFPPISPRKRRVRH